MTKAIGSMKLLSLATVTRVDASVEPRRIHRKGGVLIFHSEAERLAWLWAVEQYEHREQEREAEEENSPVVRAERALLRR